MLPAIQNDRVLVPFRSIFEALDMEVMWDGGTVTAASDEIALILQIDNPVMLVGETPITLDTAPTIVQSRTLVPLRVISETIGAEVSWDEDTRQVTIVTE